MSWFNAAPPFPPPGYQTRPPHPPSPSAHRFGAPPADAGNGVDHTYPDHGLEFGPGSFNAWTGPFGFGGTWGPRGRGGWGFGLGPRGGRRGHGGHHSYGHYRGHEQNNEEDLYDVTAAAAAAEADMEAANQAQGQAAEKDKDASAEKANPDSPTTMAGDAEYPDPPEEAPGSSSFSPRRRHHGHGCRGGRDRARGGRGFGFGRGFGPQRGPPPILSEQVRHMLRLASEGMGLHQEWRGAAAAGQQEKEENMFTPPVDLFETRDNWTVHVALPGARKEDLGVEWDTARSVLVISGVVHRLGDEEFLGGLVSSERRIGMFERKITLPPVTEDEGPGPRDEVDGDNIQARMQDGILVVVVPKAEKDWTEVKKIDVL